MKIAHIVNPVVVGPESDLRLAQEVTFATMLEAKNTASGSVEVDLYSAQYPEDRVLVPAELNMTPDLDRSIIDFGPFEKERKLPLIADILDRLYEAATDADYLIYTNVDIAVQPEFYLEVQRIIESGYDTFTINRRTISDRFSSVEELPDMLVDAQNASLPHPGNDCFVFPRAIYPSFRLANTCIGVVEVGKVIMANMLAFGTNFKRFDDLFVTFHIGDDGFHRGAPTGHRAHNTDSLLSVYDSLITDILTGHFSSVGSKDFPPLDQQYKVSFFKNQLAHAYKAPHLLPEKREAKFVKQKRKYLKLEKKLAKLLAENQRLQSDAVWMIIARRLRRTFRK